MIGVSYKFKLQNYEQSYDTTRCVVRQITEGD